MKVKKVKIPKNKKVKLPKIGFFLLIFVLLTSLLLNLLQEYLRTENYRVTRVVDGDSFDLKDGRRIRLLSLDAPEKNRCFYPESRERLKSLILNKKVKLKDVVTDDYGRILADVFVDPPAGGFVNKIMLAEGLARFSYVKIPYYEELKSISLNAKNLKKGIYSPLCRTTSTDPDCLIKANINHGEKFYFTPNCRNYQQVIIDEAFGDRWFCTEDDAVQEGFIKASGC